ncbi:hypothetical protein [Pontibacter pamirensis]|uniref:hypothetical protein n=1 Tax=Pontibacter pamirensis TaxID=2562824 RepID=UPI0013895895|nr:hypothetical protein [Pontibacter pamirensis]
MNKKLIFLLSVSFASLASCVEPEPQQEEKANDNLELAGPTINRKTEIVDTKWVNTIANPLESCSDSLHFLSNREVVLYDCEMDWHFDANYSIAGDTIKIAIVEAQFEVDNYKEFEPTSVWRLRKTDGQLAVSSIVLLRNNKWEEISAEDYKRIGVFKKIK